MTRHSKGNKIGLERIARDLNKISNGKYKDLK
jgi:hypothetical protein